MKNLPLDGIRIIDFGQMWAGPHLSEWLAVMGAEVIKVETSLKIDFMRTVGIPGKYESDNINAGTAFTALNYGKKSITINMKSPRAVELMKKLVEISDVVTENFGGPVLDSWGIGYEELKNIRQGIILYAGSGYGRTGPHRARPSYAEIVEAMDGSTFLNGFPGGESSTVGVSPWTDATQAMHGAFAIMAALFHRSKTGQGQYIDAAMLEGSANFQGEPVMGYMMNKSIGEMLGNRDKVMAPHGCYHCKGEDEWVAIAVSNEDEWQTFINIMGNPGWTTRAEFNNETNRRQNQDELDGFIEEWTRNYSQYEVMTILQNAGLMSGASLNIQHLVDDPQLKERGFFVKMEHPVLGDLTLPRLPWRPDGETAGNYDRAPLLGEHNNYVFGQLLGLTGEEISGLIEEKVIC